MARRARPRRIHATAVAVGGKAVLLRGPSGSGKSDLALRLIQAGAVLIADDACDLSVMDGGVSVSAPPEIRGLLEVRGIGIVRMRYRVKVPVALAVDLVKPAMVERMPPPRACRLQNVMVPLVRLAPFEESAVAKIRLLCAFGSNRVVSRR
jgi:serine kinase of HPr protein (carbohydrate metabolism regulator)